MVQFDFSNSLFSQGYRFQNSNTRDVACVDRVIKIVSTVFCSYDFNMKEWKHDYIDGTEEVEELQPTPLVPITANPLPFGSLKKQLNPTKSKKLSADRYRKALQDFLYFVQMPMSIDRLSKTTTGQLRAIAKLFKAYDGDEMRSYSKQGLIRFICGYQQEPQNYRPLPRLQGIEYPPLEDQRYREMFMSKVDPWMRPRQR